MKFGIGVCLILGIVVSETFAVKYATQHCDRKWKKLGCYKDNVIGPLGRPLGLELVNRRDPTNPNWDGFTINWRDYPTTLHALYCECAKRAGAKGHKVFGLQFYGECWSAKDGENALASFARDGKALEKSDCVGVDYQPCNDESDSECVGKQFRNYIYMLDDSPSQDVTNGNWGEWAQWSTCTKTCAGGVRFRERACDNPEPGPGGAYCEGEGEAQESCNTEPCQPICKKKLDVGIVLDGSSSVTSKNWKKTLEFVNMFAKEFVVDPNEVHFGVLHYSWRVTVDFKIADQQYWNYDALATKVSSIVYPYGGTRTDLALTSAHENFFCGSECGSRDGVPQVLVVITDGKTSYNASPVKDAADPLKGDGVTIITVGVASADRTELEEMATDNDHVFMLTQYEYLSDKINKMLKLTCEAKNSKRRRRR